MVCDVIEPCRCYAYKDEKEQWCGVRKGLRVLPCPADCCAGGCPDDRSRQPFRYIDRPAVPINALNKTSLFFIWLFVTIMSIAIFRNLKITRVRKI